MNRRSRATIGSDPHKSGQRRLTVFLAFVAMTFILGGGARDDLQSLLLLRPAAVGFGAWALLAATPGDLRAVRTPLALLAALLALITLQLIPLPPRLWHALPGREGIVRRDALVGLGDLWRPLSLSPSKTWNSLVSLAVPLAALLVAAVQPATQRLRMAEIVLIVAGASAVLGLAQVLGPDNGPLYLYNITNQGTAVGLFANRNHHGVFLAATLPLLGWYFLFAMRSELLLTRPWIAGVLGSGGLWLVVELMTGSRAGLVLFALAMGMVFFLFLVAVKQQRFVRNRRSAARLSSTKVRIGLGVGLIAAICATVWVVPNLPVFKRFGGDNYATDVRFSAAPTVVRLAHDAFPVGIGFGAFEHVYKAYEPDALLTDSYFNQAHDDFLQLAAEAGLAGLVVLALALIFLLGRVRALLPWLRRAEADAWLAATSLGSIGLLAIASAVDYPLRSPSLMAFAIVLVAFSLYPSRQQQSDEQR